MKVITVKQPWATLISEGYKVYEFRTWKTKYRGPILIHAGKGVDKTAMERFKKYNLSYPSGCIIAASVLTDCIKIDDNMRKYLKKENSLVYKNIEDKNWNGYGFKLENTVKINPIQIKGKLSLWEYKEE